MLKTLRCKISLQMCVPDYYQFTLQIFRSHFTLNFSNKLTAKVWKTFYCFQSFLSPQQFPQTFIINIVAQRILNCSPRLSIFLGV